MLIAEIQYFIAFSAVKKLVLLEKLTLEEAQKVNYMLAEQYGVRSYDISSPEQSYS